MRNKKIQSINEVQNIRTKYPLSCHGFNALSKQLDHESNTASDEILSKKSMNDMSPGCI